MYKSLSILLFAYGFAVSTEDIYENKWALIIGIDKYQNETNLRYAVDDAEAIQNLLVTHFGYSENQITLLTNDNATLQNIKSHLGKIANNTGKNDAFLVFYAGHGITLPTHQGGEMGYLLPVDGDKNNIYATCLPMSEVKNIGSISTAKHVLFLMDACYGGLMAMEYRSLEKNTPGYLKKLAREKSRQIITAGGKGEKVMEKAIWGHSAFTKNLISALRDNLADDGDGFITANELAVYLKKRVTIDSGYRQTPQIQRYGSDEGEFIFINQNKLTPHITHSSKLKQNNNGKDFTLAQLVILEDNKLSIQEWSKYKKKGVNFNNFINYKHEIKYKSKALIRSIIFPGWGQYYTENSARGLIYSGSFIFGVINIVFSPGLLNKPPFNDPLIGKTLWLYSSIISYGIAPLDAVVSVNLYNKELQKKYNISYTPLLHYNQVSVNISYTF